MRPVGDPEHSVMRVIVIGGRGHLGRAVVAGLRKQAIEVAVAGRSRPNDVRVDITDPTRLDVLDDFDAVVNCSDSLAAAPDELVRRCLLRGPLLLETVGEPVAIRRLLGASHPTGHGTVLLGAGIFPGMSNLIAAEAIAAVEACTSVELAMRWNPMSAGGGGMVALVPHLLGVPTHRVVEGDVVEGPPMGPGPELPFSDGRHATLHLPFTEPTMLARTHPQLANIATYGSVDPDAMMLGFRVLPGWLMRRRIVRWLMWLQFTLLRRVLLRRVPAHVRICARATNARGDEAVRTFVAEDGIGWAGEIVAAMLLELSDVGPGLHLPDAVLTAELVRARLSAPRSTATPVSSRTPLM